MTVRVLSTMEFGRDWLDAVAADERVEISQFPATEVSELPSDLLSDIEVMYTNSVLPSPEQAPGLRWVQLDTSGVDHVRGTPLWEAEYVTITSIAGISPQPMAEYVMAAVLGFARRLPTATRMREQRHWPTNSERWEIYAPLRVSGSRMTIVGYGRIGRAIARAARAFDIEVTGVRRSGGRDYGGEVEGVEVKTLDNLQGALESADWIVVCVPKTQETINLIGARQFEIMKEEAHLVDISRGGVVEERALLASLDSGRLAGAALDVFDPEPLSPDSPLWTHPKVIATPHISGLASDYEERVLDLFRENIARYLNGETLVNVIDRRLGY